MDSCEFLHGEDEEKSISFSCMSNAQWEKDDDAFHSYTQLNSFPNLNMRSMFIYKISIWFTWNYTTKSDPWRND